MAVAEVVSGSVSREELGAFHLTGRGLDGLRVAGRLRPVSVQGAPLEPPPLEPVYPVPGAADSMPFQGSALPPLYGAFLAAGRAAARARFLRELRQCCTNLQDLLAVDDAKRSPASADRVAASLGADATRFLSASRLMAVFGRRAGKPAVMDPERRRRCEAALSILEEGVRRQQDSPVFWLLHAEDDAPVGLSAVDGRARPSADPCADALAFCEVQLAEVVPVLRAMRLARLEAVAGYDPAIHDEALERFDREAAEPHEMAAMPVAIAIERGDRLSFNSFSQVLLSGKPVQVLIKWSWATADVGAIALAHGDAFVLQTSMARWDHLSKGFAEMAQRLEPAVAVVSVPAAECDSATAWREASLVARSRAFPLYRYDPGCGGEWADRFELEAVEATGLDALVLSASLRDHCRAIPPGTADDGLLEIGEYLKRRQAVPPFTIPFVRFADEAGNMQRMAVTREIVRLCLERNRAWEMLTSLAAKPKPAVEQSSPAEDPAAIREAGAREAYMRVVALLANPESLARQP